MNKKIFLFILLVIIILSGAAGFSYLIYKNYKSNLDSKIDWELKEKLDALKPGETVSVIVSLDKIDYSEFKGIKIEKTLKTLPIFTLTGTKDEIMKLPYFSSISKIYLDKEVAGSIIEPPSKSNGELINSHKAWEKGLTGEGVPVCVIDTGINYTNPALKDRVVSQYDFVNNRTNAMDDNGHGTFVAGIIASDDPRNEGVAPGVSLLSAKALNANNNGSYSLTLQAMDWCVQKGAKVINMSLGGDFYKTNCDSDILGYAANKILEKYNILVVAATGNRDKEGMGSPSCASKTIAVGAVDESNYATWWSSSGARNDIVSAPGNDIVSLYRNGFEKASGTSFSAPFVAGAAALLLQAKPEAGVFVENIKEAIYSTTISVKGCYDCKLFVDGVCKEEAKIDNCGTGRTGQGVVNIPDAYKAVTEMTLKKQNPHIAVSVPPPQPPVNPAPSPQPPPEPGKQPAPGQGGGNSPNTGVPSPTPAPAYKPPASQASSANPFNFLFNQPKPPNLPFFPNFPGGQGWGDNDNFEKPKDRPKNGQKPGSLINNGVSEDQKINASMGTNFCWPKDTRGYNLLSEPSQVNKFCKCLSGIYGYQKFNTSNTKASSALSYTDSSNDQEWSVEIDQENTVVSSITCPDSQVYYPNKAYSNDTEPRFTCCTPKYPWDKLTDEGKRILSEREPFLEKGQLPESVLAGKNNCSVTGLQSCISQNGKYFYSAINSKEQKCSNDFSCPEVGKCVLLKDSAGELCVDDTTKTECLYEFCSAPGANKAERCGTKRAGETQEDFVNRISQYSSIKGEFTPNRFCNETAKPQIQTLGATNILKNQASLNGRLSDMKGNKDVQVGFQWGKTVVYGNQSPFQVMNSTGSFNAVIINLDPNTTYHFTAVAKNNAGSIVYGKDLTFTTKGQPTDVCEEAGGIRVSGSSACWFLTPTNASCIDFDRFIDMGSYTVSYNEDTRKFAGVEGAYPPINDVLSINLSQLIHPQSDNCQEIFKGLGYSSEKVVVGDNDICPGCGCFLAWTGAIWDVKYVPSFNSTSATTADAKQSAAQRICGVDIHRK